MSPFPLTKLHTLKRVQMCLFTSIINQTYEKSIITISYFVAGRWVWQG